MELFSYSRYFGEDEPTTSKQSDVSEFLNKVKLRKNKRKTEDILTTENPLDKEVEEKTLVEVDISKSADLEAEGGSHSSSKLVKKCSILKDDTKDSTLEVKEKQRKKKKKGKKGKNDVKEVDTPTAPNVVSVEKKEEVNFEVLGNHDFQNKPKVKRVLPRWLAEPFIISNEVNDVQVSESDLVKLNPKLKTNLTENGITSFFPVQSAVIPLLISKMRKSSWLWPRDLCVSAPTGSGKTLAYVLPILHAKTGLMGCVLHALVVVPVQELAVQVSSVFKKFAKGTGINVGVAIGGTSFNTESKTLVGQKLDGSYYSLVDVLVATPGRLVEHLQNTPGFSLKHLKFIVIDEADRVMEQKSLNWLHLVEKQFDPVRNGLVPPVSIHNLSKLSRRPQKLLFSATLSQDPEKLLQLNLFQPLLFTSVSASKRESDSERGHFIGKFTTPLNIKESYIVSSAAQKPLVINKLLLDGWRKVLCFTKSCVEADRLCKLLSYMNPELIIKGLSTLMNLLQREQVLSLFEDGRVDLLVCSDRMARGMDIKCIEYVILYDPPKFIKGYIHRVGRTGRAGLPGTAVTLITPNQENGFREMLSIAGKKIDVMEIDKDQLDEKNESYVKALEFLQSVVDQENKSSFVQLKKEKRKVVKTKFSSKKLKTS